MNERIRVLADRVMRQELRFVPVPTEYDREDLFLTDTQRSAKRVCEYILNQEPILTQEQCFTGFFKFDGSVEGDHFTRVGYVYEGLALEHFYKKPLRNLATLEWQHSTADFEKVMRVGIEGLIAEIDESIAKHSGEEELEFLHGIRAVADTIVLWAEKCSRRAAEAAEKTEVPAYRANLMRLSEALTRVPRRPARNFYEAVLSLYVCFSFDPDSIGTIDRYFRPYYERDLAEGTLTKDEAAAYLQELFLMLQMSNAGGGNFYRGGQSHFCVGGYLPDGTDGFTELSRLIIDALLDLPTFIPQISLRRTAKMKYEDFAYVLKRAVNDPQMRIAFVNDEPRIRGFMEIVGMSYADAVTYTMVGCNEPALPGGVIMGSAQENIARFIENVFYKRREDVLACGNFEEFYALAAEEMRSDLAEIIELDTKLNLLRARDNDIVSSMFFRGCIANAKAMNRGGCEFTTAMLDLIGFTTAIDSISVVKQFVYDEKRCTMAELCAALDADWKGHEVLRALIGNKGKFFGNDDETSNAVAVRLYDTMYEFLKDKTDMCGKHYIVGDLIGYWQHNVWFGAGMKATPDGRHAGDRISFGRGQSEGRDRAGLTALLNAVAKCDPRHLVCGPTVTNLMLDAKIVRDPAQFEKLTMLLDRYFTDGGMHFQLSYTDRATLEDAQKNPGKYKTLRVRVSGFSDYFNNLNEDLQCEIIDRTQIDG